MKSSLLKYYFSNLISSIDFSNSIKIEVETYANLLAKEGSSIPIYFEENENLTIEISFFVKLLKDVVEGKISDVALSYICDCITLGEQINFENDLLRNLVFEIADPEINGGFKSNSELKLYIEELESA